MVEEFLEKAKVQNVTLSISADNFARIATTEPLTNYYGKFKATAKDEVEVLTGTSYPVPPQSQLQKNKNSFLNEMAGPK